MLIGAARSSFDYGDFFPQRPNVGYETLLYDCMLGDATLFQRADMVEAGWSVIGPVQEAWKQGGKVPSYSAGSWGPPEATALMARDDREWNEISDEQRMQTIPPPAAKP